MQPRFFKLSIKKGQGKEKSQRGLAIAYCTKKSIQSIHPSYFTKAKGKRTPRPDSFLHCKNSWRRQRQSPISHFPPHAIPCAQCGYVNFFLKKKMQITHPLPPGFSQMSGLLDRDLLLPTPSINLALLANPKSDSTLRTIPRRPSWRDLRQAHTLQVEPFLCALCFPR